jgi:hypothetical protein
MKYNKKMTVQKEIFQLNNLNKVIFMNEKEEINPELVYNLFEQQNQIHNETDDETDDETEDETDDETDNEIEDETDNEEEN